MPRSSRIMIGLRLVAASTLLAVFATSSAEAKQKSYAAEKGPGAAKHNSAIAAKRKVAKKNAAKRKSPVAAKQVSVTATPRTPLKGGLYRRGPDFLYASANSL
jgi:hypothetical protein